jgi:thioredoxin 1
MGDAMTVKTDTFKKDILEWNGLAVVDFGATWCGPCQALAPTIEELAKEYANSNVRITKCDVDESEDLAAEWGITSVPTIMFFKSGKKVDSMLGNQKRATLKDKIEKLKT